MTIQLNEIAGYLPYQLRCMHGSDDDLREGVVNGIDWYLGCPEVKIKLTSVPFELFHPLLQPMDKLASRHYFDVFKSEKPEYITDLDFGKLWEMVHYVFSEVIAAPFWFIQLLYKHHFDIHNLIGRGLAIDINSLKY